MRGIRVAQYRVSNPHTIPIAVSASSLGAALMERSWSTQIAALQSVPCPAVRPCALGMCQLGGNTCEAVVTDAVAPTKPAVRLTWRSTTSYTSPVLAPNAEDGAAYVLQPKDTVYVSVALDTRGSCAVLPQASFNGQSVYLMPTATSSCAAPQPYIGLGGCWTTYGGGCNEVSVLLGHVMSSIRFRWESGGSTAPLAVDTFFPGAPGTPKFRTKLFPVVDSTIIVGN